MPIGNAVAVVVMGLAMVAFGRSRHDRDWLFGGVAVLVGAGAALALRGVDARLIGGTTSSLLTLSALLFALFFGAEAFGLPSPIATRLGIGLISRSWQFNYRLWEERKAFIAALGVAQRDPMHRARAIERAEGRLRRIHQLRPPDPDWAALRDELVTRDETFLAFVRSATSTDEVVALQAEYSPLLARWDELRERYRAEAAVLKASPAGRLSRDFVWRVLLGAACLLAGVASLRMARFPVIDVGDVELWLGIVAVASGLVFLATSVLPPLRRWLA